MPAVLEGVETGKKEPAVERRGEGREGRGGRMQMGERGREGEWEREREGEEKDE